MLVFHDVLFGLVSMLISNSSSAAATTDEGEVGGPPDCPSLCIVERFHVHVVIAVRLKF